MSADPSRALGANTLPAGETEKIQTLIETWTSHLMAGRFAEWESFWAEEAVLMPAGRPRLIGRSNIADYVTREFGSGMEHRFTEWSYTGRDDLAVVTNMIELSTKGMDGAPSTSFNQIIVLRRGADEGWRIQTVIFTPTAPSS